MKKKYRALYPNDYEKTETYYIESYINVKRVLKVQAYDEEHAIQRVEEKEEKRKMLGNIGYLFVDSDYNVVEEKDYESYKQDHKSLRAGGD